MWLYNSHMLLFAESVGCHCPAKLASFYVRSLFLSSPIVLPLLKDK